MNYPLFFIESQSPLVMTAPMTEEEYLRKRLDLDMIDRIMSLAIFFLPRFRA